MVPETRPSKVGKWTEPARRVLRERYLSRKDGEVTETPEEMCWRVATSIAAGEARYGRTPAAVREIAEAFYDMMVDGEFLPNSPTLMNAGKGNGLQYSACYVLPVGDSMEEIFDSVKAAAIIHKSGGGTGFAFSRLRPKDDLVASTVAGRPVPSRSCACSTARPRRSSRAGPAAGPTWASSRWITPTSSSSSSASWTAASPTSTSRWRRPPRSWTPWSAARTTPRQPSHRRRGAPALGARGLRPDRLGGVAHG